MDTRESPALKTVYVVHELYWEYNDNWYELEADVPVYAYISREDAESARRAFEAEQRAKWTGENLGHVFTSTRLTSRSDADFLDVLTARKLPLPPDTEPLYWFPDMAEGRPIKWWDADWWDALWTALPAEEVWGLFDGIVFSEVVEMEVV